MRLAKVYDFVPSLDEALLAIDYAEMFDEAEEDVILSIRRRRILGVQHKGEWYVEAPPFYLDALHRVNQLRIANARRQQEEFRSHQDEDHRANTRGGQKELIYYGQVLGLKGQVTFDDIRRRYRDLVAQYHPDKVSHLGPKLKEVAESEMKEINEAYQFFKHQHERRTAQQSGRGNE